MYCTTAPVSHTLERSPSAPAHAPGAVLRGRLVPFRVQRGPGLSPRSVPRPARYSVMALVSRDASGPSPSCALAPFGVRPTRSASCRAKRGHVLLQYRKLAGLFFFGGGDQALFEVIAGSGWTSWRHGADACTGTTSRTRIVSYGIEPGSSLSQCLGR